MEVRDVCLLLTTVSTLGINRLMSLQYILEDLKNLYGLSSEERRKPMTASQDLDVLLRYLWAEDQHVYKREHFRIQLALLFLMLTYTAARIGAVVVSDAYRQSNQALTFRVSSCPEEFHRFY
jgi:hypothetical protein